MRWTAPCKAHRATRGTAEGKTLIKDINHRCHQPLADRRERGGGAQARDRASNYCGQGGPGGEKGTGYDSRQNEKATEQEKGGAITK